MPTSRCKQQGSTQIIVLVAVAVVLAAAYVALDYYTAGEKLVLGAESRGAAVISALSRYRLETGSFPDTLDKLVPKHLESLPKCPNGEPFAYQLAGGEYTLTCQKVVFKTNPYSYSSKNRGWGG